LILTTSFANAVHLQHHIAGLTILALGAQVPDTFASIAVARAGEGPSAISNAVGSQVLNILIGIGLPFFFYNIVTGFPLRQSGGPGAHSEDSMGQEGIILIGYCLAVLVLVFLALAIRVPFCRKMEMWWRGTPYTRAELKPSLEFADAIILLALYVATTITVVLQQVYY